MQRFRRLWLPVLLVACGAEAPGARSDPPVTAQSTRTPPAYSGGTVLVTSSFVYAANPDKGVVDVIDLDAGRVVWTAGVGHASEPGRLAEDPSGRVHVVLRAAGALATLDPQSRTITTTAVCPAPRGIAIDSEIRIACAGGELVSLPLDLSTPRTLARLGRDLRDVVSSGGHLYVSRFRSAELIAIDP